MHFYSFLLSAVCQGETVLQSALSLILARVAEELQNIVNIECGQECLELYGLSALLGTCIHLVLQCTSVKIEW